MVKELKPRKLKEGKASKNLKVVSESRPGFNIDIISGYVEKVKFNLFLKGTWNATLTIENKIYIEVMKGQMLDKLKWDQLKAMAPIPENIKETLQGFYDYDWSKLV